MARPGIVGAFVSSALLFAAATGARAQCACPGGPPLPVACTAAAQVSNGSCQYSEACGVFTCPAGDQVEQIDFCDVVLFRAECRHDCTAMVCTACQPGTYGSDCLACPNCNGGICIDGINGSGFCSNCPVGRNGPYCQYTRAGTCDGHGSPKSDGSCDCDTGLSGQQCNACATGYYGFPNCKACSDATCNFAETGGHCDLGNGNCLCGAIYSGADCQACAPDHYNWPSCTFCTAAATCSGHGGCSTSGNCVCE